MLVWLWAFTLCIDEFRQVRHTRLFAIALAYVVLMVMLPIVWSNVNESARTVSFGLVGCKCK